MGFEAIDWDIEKLTAVVLATGALGTAAFGIVEGLKGFGISESGYAWIRKILGSELFEALQHAYGTEYESFLLAQYGNGRGKGEIRRTLRQGIRIGLPGISHPSLISLVATLPGVEITPLSNAITAIRTGTTLDDQDRQNLARFELAVDARIDAALALAETRFKTTARMLAMMISIGLALGVNSTLTTDFTLLAIIIGVAAVPIAPVAKDIAKGLRSAEKALRARS